MTGNEPERWWAVLCLTAKGAQAHGDGWPKDRAQAEALAREPCPGRCGARRVAIQIEQHEGA